MKSAAHAKVSTRQPSAPMSSSSDSRTDTSSSTTKTSDMPFATVTPIGRAAFDRFIALNKPSVGFK
jgi:hypothetical protein